MNIKALIEKRAEQQAIMDGLVTKAETETRALTEDEVKAFDAAEAEIRAIDDTIARAEKSRNLAKPPEVRATEETTETTEQAEERAFAAYVLSVTEDRAGEQNLTMGNNGAIIPTTIANRIIKKVKDISPILARATIYAVKGTLKVPVWGMANTTHDIAVGYATEFSALTADAGKFTSVDLGGFLVGALTLIGESVENNGSFSVVDFIVNQMAEEIAIYLEGQALTGTGTNAMQGACNTTTNKVAASASVITADELIDVQALVKQAYQANACWTMAPATFAAIRKLKDSSGRYLLQDDITGDFPYRLLGKPVYLSDNMPAIASGAKVILYGDYSGLSVNWREGINIKVLREQYATQHAIGVVSWMEIDSRVTDHAKLATLTMG